jgi:carboxypeptidase D
MAEDFLQFLSNLVKIFPSLSKRPLYLTGESYAGVYIVSSLFNCVSSQLTCFQPYISRALFSSSQPPVTLKKIAIGDGSIGSLSESSDVPTVSILETYPQLINFDQEVFEYFESQ